MPTQEKEQKICIRLLSINRVFKVFRGNLDGPNPSKLDLEMFITALTEQSF